ncbi:MAG: heme-degrading monooxygenase HmoA [Saprospiraceae bacterium]|jgi:heme-degrading monooxygenase HmoA
MQITTLSFFHYRGLRNKLWAFGMMQFAHQPLAKIKGLTFYKLMGSGKGLGFNPLPDWGVYALLQVWESEAAADSFLKNTELMQRYRARTTNIRTYYMKNITAKGEWSGSNPFQVSTALDKDIQKLAIITRATIKPSKLLKFWSYVPTSHRSLSQNPGLIYTKGIGEVPIIQMATFSLWENKEALNQFAYQSKEHAQAIKMTRELDWYKEELFARFQVFRTRTCGQG